ncbi:MAG: GNAT family N-acetyltransferase [Deltaproteobacteria bacterium]|nr:GNAT family N-acetyltransferase [Deltaproteobacteria bacterium]MDQ3296451.1 GNAT family N-acetyltransferase [Myxococcota bacterium]
MTAHPTLTADEIFEEVIVAPRRAFPVLPDTRVIERPGWLQIVTPSIKTGGLNEVIYSALPDDEAEAIIDATLAQYRELGLKFRWNAGPGSAPADLGTRLLRCGLVESWGRGMARTIDDTIVADAAIAVDAVDATNVDVFSRVMAEGWDTEVTAIAALNRALVAAPGVRTESRQRMFIASCDREPAATASYVALPRSAYLVGGVVLPRFRGRGLYRALVNARLVDARARGLVLATSHAREATSAPILERLGFTTVCRFPLYFG